MKSDIEIRYRNQISYKLQICTDPNLRVSPMIECKTSQFADKLIDEFENKGFVASFSNCYLLNMLRERYNIHFRVFSAGCKTSVGRLAKYGVYQIFGERISYFYDKRKEKQFTDFLVDRFYSHNQEPSQDVQRAFTRMLHVRGMCWSGCVAIIDLLM